MFAFEAVMSVVVCPLMNKVALQAHVTPLQSDRAGLVALAFRMCAIVQL